MISGWLVRRFVPSPDDVANPRARAAYGVLEGWVAIVIDVVIFVIKIVPGVAIGSISLIADAVNSLGDILASGVVIWGFKLSSQPSDSEHPFGHGRAEAITTLVIGILLAVAAWECAQNSVLRLLEPHPVRASVWLLLVLAATMVLKEWLSRFARRLGRAIDSSALQGDFWHHRSDVFATGVVIVSLAASRAGMQWVDGVGGLAVAVFIASASWRLARESLDPLIGQAPSPGLLAQIRDLALAVPEVDEVHDVVVHTYGGFMAISLHVEIPGSLDLAHAHDIAESVEDALNNRFGGAAVVHVDPVNRSHPLYGDLDVFLRSTVPQLPGAEGFHDVRIVGSEARCYVILDLKAETGRAPEASRALQRAVVTRFPSVAKVVVNVEPRYVY